MKIHISISRSNIKESFTPTDAVHYGDLGVARDTVRKRIDGGRSTGHFGSGVYFLSSDQNAYARSDRPKKYLDLTGLNLFTPHDSIEAINLHKALRLLNDMAGDIYFAATHREQVPKFNFDSINSIGGKTIFELSKILPFSITLIEKQVRKVLLEESGNFDNIRSASTRLMQKFGYDGIDVRHTNLNNGDYGSVVFI